METKAEPIRKITYRCTNCGEEKPREDLLARRVVFTTIKPVRTVLSRVTGWWCGSCRAQDPIWNSEPRVNSPGVTAAEEAAS